MQNYIRLAAEASQESPANQSLIILITGFVVVFMMLLLLIFCIKIYSGIVYAVQNKSASKTKVKEKTQENAAPVAVPQVIEKSESEGVDLQTIAVITAAVEAFYGGSNKVRIAGIRPAGSARNEWGSAGIRENMPSMRMGGLL